MTWLFLIVLLILASVAYGAWVFAPWVPMHAEDMPRALELIGDLRGKTFVELGSGDARMTVFAKQSGAKEAIGYEIAIPMFVAGVIRAMHTQSRVRLVWGSFLKADLSQADIVFLFGTPKTNADAVRRKLEHDLRSGAMVVSYAFEIAGWQPVAVSRPSPNDLPIYKYVSTR